MATNDPLAELGGLLGGLAGGEGSGQGGPGTGALPAGLGDAIGSVADPRRATQLTFCPGPVVDR